MTILNEIEMQPVQVQKKNCDICFENKLYLLDIKIQVHNEKFLEKEMIMHICKHCYNESKIKLFILKIDLNFKKYERGIFSK